MKIYGDKEQEESDLAKTSKKFNLGTNNDTENNGETEAEPSQEENVPAPPVNLVTAELKEIKSVPEAGFYLFVYEQKDEQDKNKIIATYYICRTEMQERYTYNYYSKTNKADQAQQAIASFDVIAGLNKSKAEEGWLAFDNNLPTIAAHNLLLSSRFKAHKDDVVPNANAVLEGQRNANTLRIAQEAILRELAIENIKGRRIQAIRDQQTQINT